MKYRTGTSTYCLPACMQGGRQEGRHPERISNEYRTYRERISNASRPKMRAPVSTCSAVPYSTVRPTPGTSTRLMYEYSWYEVPYWYEYLLPACWHAGRQAAGSRHPERIPNAFRQKMRAPVSTCSAVQYSTHTQRSSAINPRSTLHVN